PLWGSALAMIVLLSQAGLQLLQGWFIRDNKAPVIGKTSVTLNIARGACQIIFGLIVPLWWILSIGEFIGRISSTIHMIFYKKSSAFFASMNKYSGKEIIWTLKFYKD